MNLKRLFLMILGNFFKLPKFIFYLYKALKDKNLKIEEKFKNVREIIINANKKGRVKIIVEGKENIPKENGYLICPNHQGFFDSLALIEAIDIPFSAVVNKKYGNKIFLKQIIKILNLIEIDRNDIRNSFEVIKEVAKRLENKENVLIFPEGTRSKNKNELNDMLPGAFKAIKYSKKSILPVSIIDSYKVFEEKGIEKIKVKVNFLKEIKYEEYKDLKTIDIAKMLKNLIQEDINIKKR